MSQNYFWSLLAKKLSGEASEEELQELEQFLNEYPDLLYTTRSLEDLWLHKPEHGLVDAQEKFEETIRKLKQQGVPFPFIETASTPASFIRGRTTRRLLAAAASVVILAFTAFYLLNKQTSRKVIDSDKQVSEVYTRPGTRTKLILPDSSVVWLNASSQLSYDKNFGKKLREVTLTGEGFFDVTKDAERPFVIHTQTIDIKVLGTEFNVKAYPGDANTETSLIRGSVEVTVKNRDNEKLYLKPNEKVIVANTIPEKKNKPTSTQDKPFIAISPLHYLQGDSTIIETSWVNNKLIFQENETFTEAAFQMERWFGVHISFASERVANYHLFASFTNETISQALDELKLGFQFSYKIDGNNITIAE